MITLNANALCSRNDVKDFVKILAAGNDIDDFINSTINRISTMFESFCHRQFISTEYTEIHDGDRGTSLGSFVFPKNTPVTAISAIYEDSDWDWPADSEIDSDDYRIVEGGTSIVYDGVFTKGLQSLKVVYTGGYTSNTLPEDIKQAAIIEVARIVKHRTDFDVLTANRDDGTVQYTQNDFLPLTLKTLYNYRILYVI